MFFAIVFPLLIAIFFQLLQGSELWRFKGESSLLMIRTILHQIHNIDKNFLELYLAFTHRIGNTFDSQIPAWTLLVWQDESLNSDLTTWVHVGLKCLNSFLRRSSDHLQCFARALKGPSWRQSELGRYLNERYLAKKSSIGLSSESVFIPSIDGSDGSESTSCASWWHWGQDRRNTTGWHRRTFSWLLHHSSLTNKVRFMRVYKIRRFTI